MSENHNIYIRNFLKLLLVIASVIAGLFIALKVSVFLFPFILALSIASLIEPIIRLISTRLKLPRKIAAGVTLILVVSTFGSILILIISKLITEVTTFSAIVPGYLVQAYDELKILISKATDIYLGLPPEVIANIENIVSNVPGTLNIQSILSNVSTSFLNILKGISNIPQVIVFILVTILSTYFFASDKNIISSYIKSQLPDTWIVRILSIRNDMFHAFFGYVKAQLILMTITFTELSIGFTVIGVHYAILFAFIISIIDAFPILGTGGVLIPWAIYSFISGDTRMGISLLIIYGIVLVVRQMTEPKILGQQIGIHPLITLLAMYTGLNLFSIPGLILGPITMLLLKNILSGIFKNKSFKDILGNV